MNKRILVIIIIAIIANVVWCALTTSGHASGKLTCWCNRRLCVRTEKLDSLIWWQHEETGKEEVSPSELSKVEKPEKIEVTEELANKIIDKVVLDNEKYDQRTSQFLIDDLNGDGISEVIVCVASDLGRKADQAYLSVVNPIDEKGNYRKVADFVFGKDTPFLGTPCVDHLESLVDIGKDGKKEMIVNLGLMGVSGSAYGIFEIDWNSKEINWLQIRKEDGSVKDFYFVNAATAMHTAGFSLEDVDNDGTLEIVERYTHWKLAESRWEKDYRVYKWDGSIFNYDKELSNLLAETAD